MKKENMCKYGIFIYEIGNEMEPIHISFRSSKYLAVKNYVKVCSLNNFNDANSYTEIWKKDENGMYQQKGIPVWCTKASSFFEDVINANNNK